MMFGCRIQQVEIGAKTGSCGDRSEIHVASSSGNWSCESSGAFWASPGRSTVPVRAHGPVHSSTSYEHWNHDTTSWCRTRGMFCPISLDLHSSRLFAHCVVHCFHVGFVLINQLCIWPRMPILGSPIIQRSSSKIEQIKILRVKSADYFVWYSIDCFDHIFIFWLLVLMHIYRHSIIHSSQHMYCKETQYKTLAGCTQAFALNVWRIRVW